MDRRSSVVVIAVAAAVTCGTGCGGSQVAGPDMAVLCQVDVVHDAGASTQTLRYDAGGRLHAASYTLRGDRSREETREYDRAGRLVKVSVEDGENEYAPARRATYVEHRYEGERRVRTITTEVVWKSLGIRRGFEATPTVDRSIDERYRYDGGELVEVIAETAGAERATSVDTYQGGRLVARETRDRTGEVVSRSAYDYDPAGHRTDEAYAECEAGVCQTVESVRYSYDDDGRLVAVVFERPDERESIAVAYDEMGRPSRQTVIEPDGDEHVTLYRYTAGCTAAAGADRIARLIQ